MAQTQIYVDPSIAADSGSGTELNPFGDLEYGIKETDWDATNGIRVNILGGVDEVLVADLSVAMADVSSPNKSVAWTPSATAPLTFEGYTASAGDGGIGQISGGGLVSVFNDAGATGDYITFKHLHCHNTGANRILSGGDRFLAIACELSNASMQAFRGVLQSQMIGCYVHGITGTEGAAYLNNPSRASEYNFIEYEGSGEAVRIQTQGGFRYNVVIVTANADGIFANVSTFGDISTNAVFSTNNSTGTGIIVGNARAIVNNNLVEGFSGAGGAGIDMNASATALMYAANSVFDCETEFLNSPAFDFTPAGAPANETLTASPFTDAPGGNFVPIDTGNVKEGSYPNLIGRLI